MLLALDVGNSNVTIGAFDGEDIVGRWRLRTIQEQTADEWGILIRNLFTLSKLDLAAVDDVVISSVVPAVDQPLEAMSRALLPPQADVRHINPPTWGSRSATTIRAKWARTAW